MSLSSPVHLVNVCCHKLLTECDMARNQIPQWLLITQYAGSLVSVSVFFCSSAIGNTVTHPSLASPVLLSGSGCCHSF